MTAPRPSGLSDLRFGLANAGTLRAAPVVVIPQLLREAGLSPATILAEVDLAPDALDDPEGLLSAAPLGALLETCIARTGCEDFALRVGAHGGLHTLGLIGALARTAATAGQALHGIVLNLHLHDRVGVARLEVTGQMVSLGYANYRLVGAGTAHINTAAIAIAVNILRELCGERFAPGEVRLACREPRDPAPYRRFFRAPVRFNADEPLITFPTAWLSTPLGRADAQKWEALTRRFSALAATSDDDLRDKLKRLLRVVLVHEGGSEERVARHFALHRRTLNRRLHSLGTTFHALVEETRFAIARQLLHDTDMTALQIAAVLSYADASAFTRAFKRWSGTTPQRWRARQQEPIRVPAGMPGPVRKGIRSPSPAEPSSARPLPAVRARRKGPPQSADPA
jgi:AraC-like DNA-binding protein